MSRFVQVVDTACVRVLLLRFLVGIPTSTDAMNAGGPTVSGADRIFTERAPTREPVRDHLRSKICIEPINICYGTVIEVTSVRFLQPCARSVWQRTCDSAVGCSSSFSRVYSGWRNDHGR